VDKAYRGSAPVVEHSHLSPLKEREKLSHIFPGVLKNELIICKQIHKSYLADEAAELSTREKIV